MADFKQFIEEHYEEITEALMEAHRNACRFPAWGQAVSLLRSPAAGEIRIVTKDCLAGEDEGGETPGGEDMLPLHTVFSPFVNILWDYWFDNFREAIAAAEEHFGVTFRRDNEGDFLDEDGEWFEADLRDTLSICCKAAGIRESALEDWLGEQEEEAIDYLVSEEKQSGYYDEILKEAIENAGRG